jgi:2-(1,2-epoxy-1,2-dihydrophenyl)acetyl-CoA isomerase
LRVQVPLSAPAKAALLRSARSDVVVIAAVDGIAAGGGVGVAWNADIAICGESSRFIPAYFDIGLSPDCGVSHALRPVGRQRATDFLLGGRPLDGRTAQEWGLVARVVSDGEALSAALSLAREIAARPPEGVAAVKRLVGRDLDRFAAHLDAERSSISALAGSVEGRRRMRAFVGG